MACWHLGKRTLDFRKIRGGFVLPLDFDAHRSKVSCGKNFYRLYRGLRVDFYLDIRVAHFSRLLCGRNRINPVLEDQ